MFRKINIVVIWFICVFVVVVVIVVVRTVTVTVVLYENEKKIQKVMTSVEIESKPVKIG